MIFSRPRIRADGRYTLSYIAAKREARHSVLSTLLKSSMDGYKIVKYLGEGGFGQVVLAQARTTKQVSTGVSRNSKELG